MAGDTSMLPEYHKIHTLWKRDERGVVLPWDWSRPEIEYLSDLPWSWTEKVDGTNIRLGLRGSDLVIGGKTDNAQIPTHLLDAIRGMDLPDKIRAKFPDEQWDAVTFYCEGYGPKIQSGGKYRTTPGVVLFDVRVGSWWLGRKDVTDIGAALGLDVVPAVGIGSLHKAIALVAPGFKSRWGDFNAEGLVCRPAVDLFARDGRRVVCKIKTIDFDRLRRDGTTW